ncbi:S-layer homology domain-containing protein [Arthrospira sp. O9.13F]|nr:S-layer homology domain-containing protein [Arthrospira sp. O9.13F]
MKIISQYLIKLIPIIGITALLSSCANSTLGDSLQQSLEADSQLQENPPFQESAATENQPISPPDDFLKLPENFPQEIAIYPGSNLQDVTLAASDTQKTSTVWRTTDPIDLVRTYYQNRLASDGWEIVSNADQESDGLLVATKQDLQVTINLKLDQVLEGKTKFSIDYSRDPEAIASQPQPTPSESPESPDPTAATSSPTPEPETTPTPTPTPSTTGDIPQELKQFAMDVAKLGVFEQNFPNPNQAITRGEFARALVQANNKIYADIPGRQIRLAISSSQPVFTDVPANHPYFSEIQGLAEAGLIPSSLSGDTTAVQFRPDAPLTREYLILWKVPLDIRQGLPQGTVDAVEQRWGFQDASKINSNAIRAILADFDNGDNANIRRVFGFTTLFQPQKTVTRAEAATALWYFGFQGDGRTVREILEVNQTPVS